MHTHSTFHVGAKDEVRVSIGLGGEGVTLFLSPSKLDELEAAIRSYRARRADGVLAAARANGILAAALEGEI